MAAYLPVLTALVAASSVTSAVYSVLIALGMLAVVLTIAMRHGEVVTRFVGARSDDVLLLRVLPHGWSIRSPAGSLGGLRSAELIHLQGSGPPTRGLRGSLQPQ